VPRVPAGVAPLTGHLRPRELPPAAVDALAAIGAACGGEDAERVRIGLDQLVRRLAPWA
jgi:hypothetical protein